MKNNGITIFSGIMFAMLGIYLIISNMQMSFVSFYAFFVPGLFVLSGIFMVINRHFLSGLMLVLISVYTISMQIFSDLDNQQTFVVKTFVYYTKYACVLLIGIYTLIIYGKIRFLKGLVYVPLTIILLCSILLFSQSMYKDAFLCLTIMLYSFGLLTLAKQNEPHKESIEEKSFDPTIEMQKYKQLLDAGAISNEEFEQKKKELLDI